MSTYSSYNLFKSKGYKVGDKVTVKTWGGVILEGEIVRETTSQFSVKLSDNLKTRFDGRVSRFSKAWCKGWGDDNGMSVYEWTDQTPEEISQSDERRHKLHLKQKEEQAAAAQKAAAHKAWLSTEEGKLATAYEKEWRDAVIEVERIASTEKESCYPRERIVIVKVVTPDKVVRHRIEVTESANWDYEVRDGKISEITRKNVNVSAYSFNGNSQKAVHVARAFVQASEIAEQWRAEIGGGE